MSEMLILGKGGAGLEYLEEDNKDISPVYFEGILLEYTGEDEDMLKNPEECKDDLLEYPEDSDDLSEYCEDISRVYTRVLTRVDLNPDSNPAIEVGWVNPG
jgi:hypothetical protein